VIATAQPLEHGYSYGWSMGLLLPRVVRYFLGKSPTLAEMQLPENHSKARSSAAK
jgi:hypothetical protein